MGSRILLCEDEKISHDMVRRQLMAWGHDVSSAWTGAESISLAQAHPPDLILLDMLFPDTDGLAIIKKIRGMSETAQTPVVCMSASSVEATQERLGDLKVSGILAKPLRMGELQAAVDAVCGPKVVQSANDTLFLVVDESPVHQKVMGRFLENIGARAMYADTIEHAITHCQNILPRGILIDVKGDVADVKKFLTKRPIGPDGPVPVIIMVAVNDNRVVVELIQCGANDIVSKPIIMSRLQKAIESIIRPSTEVQAVNMQKTILIVEDFTITAKSLEARLKEAGFRMLLARTAEIGIDLIKRQKPDLVLLDLNLPGMNGVEFVRHLQNDNIDVPFAVISGSKETSKLKDLRQLGALKVLPKPIDIDSLLNLVHGVFSNSGSARLDRADYQVMIAVSDLIAGDVLSSSLTKESISNKLLTDGYQAIAELELQPRLVVVDALLDNTIGSDIIQKARSIPASPRLRVLVLSEFLDDDMKAELTELGADGVLGKPVNMAVFIDKVKTMLAEAAGGLTPLEFANTFQHELSELPPIGTTDYRKVVQRFGHNLAGTAGLLNEIALMDIGRQLESTAGTADMDALRAAIEDVKTHLSRIAGMQQPLEPQ